MATFKQAVDKNSWVVTIVTILTLLITTYIVYGSAFYEIKANQEAHKKFAQKDSVLDVQLQRTIRNQNMIYLNLIKLAKAQGIKLNTAEELFLNQQ